MGLEVTNSQHWIPTTTAYGIGSHPSFTDEVFGAENGWLHSYQEAEVGFEQIKLNIQKMKIMAPSPITSWQIDGETMETVTDFILGGSKITADGDHSHEIKKCLLLGRKAMTNLDIIVKSRDIANKSV